MKESSQSIDLHLSMEEKQGKITTWLDLIAEIPLDKNIYADNAYTPIRRGKIILFTKYLKKCSLKPNIIQRLACDLEKSIYDGHIAEGRDYNHMCYQVCALIDNGSDEFSQDFINRLTTDESYIKKVGSLKISDMAPEQYQYYLDLLHQKTTFQPKLNTTSLYICPRCKHRECTISNLYDRAADECTNVTVHCVNCNHHWKA